MKYVFVFGLLLFMGFCFEGNDVDKKATEDNGKWFFLDSTDVVNGAHHVKHAEIFGKYVSGYNKYVLMGVDKVKSSALDGGGYFADIKATPAESPIGYNLSFLGKELLNAPRSTSYCSGSSYAVLIESLNYILTDSGDLLTEENYEALRMQELDGGRREDGVKYWGNWNANGYGNQLAMVQYSKIGKVIEPINARPGDFVNISWKNGGGHSTIFLGWYVDEIKDTNIVYFSSQKGTNGLGDQIVNINKIEEVIFIRLTNPERILSEKFNENINYKVIGNKIKITNLGE